MGDTASGGRSVAVAVDLQYVALRLQRNSGGWYLGSSCFIPFRDYLMWTVNECQTLSMAITSTSCQGRTILIAMVVDSCLACSFQIAHWPAVMWLIMSYRIQADHILTGRSLSLNRT